MKKGVLIFIKNPYTGDVKSRLSKSLDKDIIIGLYEKFVIDLIKMLKTLKLPILICYYPQKDLEFFQKWLGLDNQYFPQIGKKAPNSERFRRYQMISVQQELKAGQSAAPAAQVSAAAGTAARLGMECMQVFISSHPRR